ncbi:MAG: MetS family NSS transporter small subunit [Thermoanaerobaculia bacterium]
MSGIAIVFMILIGGLVWGGFVGLLARAVRREGGKSTQ